MKAKYDTIGINYAQKRKSDPRIAAQIHQQLQGATKVLNIGAGAGSYEPNDMHLVALEPSIEMIEQRNDTAHPVVQGVAEKLPFPANSFSHVLTILSMHHWENRTLAFKEINRVATDKFIAVSWNPDAEAFWLTRDYFPEIMDLDKKIFPSIDEISAHFDNVAVQPIYIPEDCVDGFLAAYWKRPSAYLDEEVRNSISSFSKLSNVANGLTKLATDLHNKKWFETNKSIVSKSALDVGYILITGNIKKP